MAGCTGSFSHFTHGLSLVVATLAGTLFLAGCGAAEMAREDVSSPHASIEQLPPRGQATPQTAALNAAVARTLTLDDAGDARDAGRGFLAALDSDIRNRNGDLIWAVNAYDFLAGEPPATVNPSLWRQSRLAAQHGLFEVMDGIYQVRGYDISVITFIRGDTGWIVVDPLFTEETAAAALGLVNATLGARPVSAVIYTHSHADHFGGARGVVKPGESVRIFAPEGFAEAAVDENLLAGPHMTRRAGLMYGDHLARSATAHVGSGIGPGMAANGNVGLLLPTEEIAGPDAKRVIDGVTFEFFSVDGAEAPAEFVFYLPDFNALCIAEIATGTLHNALSLRGSKARDTLRWSKVIDEILIRYANRADVVFASHHWPTWGKENVRNHLRRHRDVYRYIHDQTLRHANAGATLHEVAALVAAPDAAQSDASVRDYYGTLNHNVKAVYQHYFGWWDGVPANFHVLPPEERAGRFVAALGGVEPTLQKGIEAFSAGDYRWSAEVLNNLVFAEPDNRDARDWLAAAYEQIGFQAESGAWRDYYLSAALELREGKPEIPSASPGNDVISAVPTLALFDVLAAQYTPGEANQAPFTLHFAFTDTAEDITVEVGRDAAFPRAGKPLAAPDAVFRTGRTSFNQLVLGKASAKAMALTGELEIDGDRRAISAFFDALEPPTSGFEVVLP